MATMGLEREIVDEHVLDRTRKRFGEAGIALPTFAQLAAPTDLPDRIREALRGIDPDAPDPRNLFRVHWYNAANRREVASVPAHVVLPREFTGVDAPVIVLLGNRFPLIRAHKVLAAYACLVPRLVTGQFDPAHHRALWPSTGNYCRGGVAISRIMGCRGVAILPEGMSRERFEWLEAWVADPEDIVRTPGVESNVKEIYDKCRELDRDPQNVIFNQFSEFGNHLVHYRCTGTAALDTFRHVDAGRGISLAAFVSATGSAGTIAAGDFLKERLGAKIVAVEALECPTLLYNGFGAHNIQGIGDKHVPLIHNVRNTDFVVGVSDEATDSLGVLFNTEVGRRYLIERRGVDPVLVEALGNFGLSGICNVVASIKIAKYMDLGPKEAVLTVATDGWEMYRSERERIVGKRFGGRFDAMDAAETTGRFLLGTATDHTLELSRRDRERVFNLGYFTWVEQQGLEVEAFEARRNRSFWVELRRYLDDWDELITAFNDGSGIWKRW